MICDNHDWIFLTTMEPKWSDKKIRIPICVCYHCRALMWGTRETEVTEDGTIYKFLYDMEGGRKP